MFSFRKKKAQDPSPRRGQAVTKKLDVHPLIRLDQQLKQLAKEHDHAVRKADRH
jgi:hypothetical protein